VVASGSGDILKYFSDAVVAGAGGRGMHEFFTPRRRARRPRRLYIYGCCSGAGKHPDRLHTHTHPFNGPFFGTTQVNRYQKGKTNLDFTEARDSECQWHQLGHMQVCTLLQTDNHTSIPSHQSHPDRLVSGIIYSAAPRRTVGVTATR